MAYEVNLVVSRVRRILEDYPYETISASDPGTATAGDLDTFDVPDGEQWDEGNIAEFQDNGEQCYVRSVSTNTLSVIRGYDGTTPAAHDVSTRIVKDPVFTYQHILDNIKNTINGLWPNAYKKVEATFAPDPTAKWYNLSDEWLDLVSVTQLFGNDDQDIGMYGTVAGYPCFLRRNLPDTIVASKVGIGLPDGIFHATNDIHATGIARITDAIVGTEFTDLFNDGVDIECIAYGTASRVVLAKEVRRQHGTDTSQADQSITPLRRAQLSQFLDAQYRKLLYDWSAFLRESIPPMMRWH